MHKNTIVEKLNIVVNNLDKLSDVPTFINTIESLGEIYVANEIQSLKRTVESIVFDLQNGVNTETGEELDEN